MSEDLERAQRAIVMALAQHSSWLHRASTASVNRINTEIGELSVKLGRTLAERLDGLSAAELQAFSAGKYTSSRLKRLNAEIEAWAQAVDEAIQSEWAGSAKELAGYEAAYAGSVMSQALTDLPVVAVTADSAYKAGMQTPVMGEMVDRMLSGIAESSAVRLNARIRQGVAAGEANQQIVRALLGTKELKYKDGLIEVTRRDAETIIRTARNHISNVAYNETYKALDVQEVMDCATLDGRTSKYCASVDGRKHKVGTSHPRPPYHPRCRTVQVPVIADGLMGNRPYVLALRVKGQDGRSTFRSIGNMTDNQREAADLKVGQVKAKTTYAGWFAGQSAEYQREWLGPSRYRLYSEGGLTLDRFVDQSGKEYNLEQLRQRDAATFKEVFGEKH
jgi:SPP1 gp7 family putative phage head morphogenesis protein